MIITLEKIINQLQSYFGKEMALDELKEWTFDLIFEDDISFKKDEEKLIKEIVFLIDDDSIDENYLKKELTKICLKQSKKNRNLERLLKIIKNKGLKNNNYPNDHFKKHHRQ
jgi:uncharacterized protein (UPF0128 family)